MVKKIDRNLWRKQLYSIQPNFTVVSNYKYSQPCLRLMLLCLVYRYIHLSLVYSQWVCTIQERECRHHFTREELREVPASPQPQIPVNTKWPVTTLDHVMDLYFLKCISSTITFDHSGPFAFYIQCVREKMVSYKSRNVNSNYQRFLPVQG